MLIIEGTDLVGKTTLCKKILESEYCQNNGHIYSHFSRLPRGFNFCSHYMDRASQFVVQDRFHMSEPVYSKIRGEFESPLTPDMYRLVDGALRMLGSMTIVVTAEPNLIRERMRSNEMYSLDDILKVNEMFFDIATKGGVWEGYNMDVDYHIRCDSVNPFPSNTMINTIINKYAERQFHL